VECATDAPRTPFLNGNLPPRDEHRENGSRVRLPAVPAAITIGVERSATLGVPAIRSVSRSHRSNTEVSMWVLTWVVILGVAVLIWVYKRH
jgi:hypothetical protein